MELNKAHLMVGFTILDSVMNNEGFSSAYFKNCLERDMRTQLIDDITIKKVLLNVELMSLCLKKFTTTDDFVLCIILSYMFFQLAHRRNELEICMAELEKRMKKEKKVGDMTTDEYFFFRRTNFELIKMVDYCIQTGQTSLQSFSNNNNKSFLLS